MQVSALGPLSLLAHEARSMSFAWFAELTDA